MHVGHELKKADAICALGSHDTRVAERAAELWLDGWAPLLVCSGSGTIHHDKGAFQAFVDSTEAETFAQVAINLGVPKEMILIENQSQNTGQNYEFMTKLLAESGVDLQTVIAVQKPYMERRTYATGKVWWPEVELLVTSPQLSLAEYPNETNSIDEHWIHAMVGDLQRIKEYPAKGFQIEQKIPDGVWAAYELMLQEGYTNQLIKP